MFRLLALIIVILSSLSLADETTRHWVFFRDKGIAPGQEQYALDLAQDNLSHRSLQRRARNHVPLAQFGDIAVRADYIHAVVSSGAHVRVVSKWLNAVSVEATTAQMQVISRLACVERVRQFSARAYMDMPRFSHGQLDSAEYGAGYRQVEQCRVPELHARGLSGNGVLMCMLDTGFETYHNSIENLDILAKRDFINNDSIVEFEAGEDSASQQYHGTLCLSAAAGQDSGNIIGPAFGATWMLAKTEYVPTETPVEEDNYVAGMEWADSAGVDITSSSLGYIDWYQQSQMDGHTTVVTQAVVEAQRRGILVVTAQGNERGSWWNSVIAPADADSILAIGAVDSLGVLSGFSSPGPTADGRTKPDCAAQGSDVYCAAAYTEDGYFYASGTSLATPIAAGICALVMEANPEWTAQQVRQAVLATASLANTPDNDYGHGLIDGVAAADFVFENASPNPILPRELALSAFPNPVNGFVTLTLKSASTQSGKLIVYDLLGRQVSRSPKIDVGVGSQRVTMDVANLSSGKYFVTFDGTSGSIQVPLVVLK